MSRRTFTQQDQTQAQRLLDKVRRSASNNETGDVLYDPQTLKDLKPAFGHLSLTLAFMRSEFQTLQSLQKGIIDLIKHRMQAQKVHFPPLSASDLSWCIPRSHDEEPAWRLLLEDPLQFPHDVLESIIGLDEWTAATPKPTEKVNSLYIRTFQVDVVLLQHVLNNMCEDGFDTHARFNYWLKRVNEEPDQNAVYTLRYCGQTADSPWQRHVRDVYAQLDTFFGRFMKTLAQTAQGAKVLREAKVHVISAALPHAATATLDLREQILVALLGDGALNTQAGGKDVITLFKEDRVNFESLRAQTLQLLETQTVPLGEAEMDNLKDYTRSIYKYVEKNPSTTRSGRSTFSEETAAMILRQATPAVLESGSAIMVTIGSDLGESHEDAEETFWCAGGRSADAVTSIYNYFANWDGPTSLEPFDPNATKKLAANGHLPFVDLFPWFSKERKDYPKAAELLRRYLNIVKPMIVLAYGERPVFAGVKAFQDFSESRFSSWIRMRDVQGRPEKYGELCLTYFDGADSDMHDPQSAVVMIPSLHPGFLSRAGIVKEKATRVFVLTSAIAWCAMSVALTIARDGPPDSREEYAKAIIEGVDYIAGPSTPFGKALLKARTEYEDCHQAYSEGQVRRRTAPALKMPRGILAPQSIRAQREAQHADATVASEDGIGGWEVAIQKDRDFEQPGTFYTLTWKDDSGKEQSIGPVPLTVDVVPGPKENRFLFFVAGGLDIRDAGGKSLGLRTPLFSVEDMDSAYDFVELWEEVTGLSFAEEMSALPLVGVVDYSEAFVPKEFFSKYPSPSSIPIAPAGPLYKNNLRQILAKVKPTLPAKPGDLLWLLEQFLVEVFPGGGGLDPLAVSEERKVSVFGKLLNFASRPKYQHHPYTNILKAIAHLSEQGFEDRHTAMNLLLVGLEILRPGYTSKRKQLARKTSDGKTVSAVRSVRTISAGPAPATVISRFSLPNLVQGGEEAGDVEDLTDDESEELPQEMTELEEKLMAGLAGTDTRKRKGGMYDEDDDEAQGSSSRAGGAATMSDKKRYQPKRRKAMGGPNPEPWEIEYAAEIEQRREESRKEEEQEEEEEEA